MRFIMYFLFLCLGYSECAKPRSVNIALETVFEFNNETDATFVETVKSFLNNIKETIDHSYLGNEYQTRRFNSLTFTEFIEDSINILKSYNDLDLAYFVELLDTEINEHDYRNCEVKITDEFSLRSFFADKLSDARTLPVSEIRRTLDNILRELKSKGQMRRRIYGFLNSLVKSRTRERFTSILNYLQLYRRRQMEPTITLRTVVEKSIRSLIKDYVCNLNYSSWRKIRHMLKMFNEDLKIPSHNSKKIYKWDRKEKIAIEENDDLYDLEILKDVLSNVKRDAFVHKNSREKKYQKNTEPEEYQSQEIKEERSKKRKGRVNTSLTNSDDILDLKMDYAETLEENSGEATKKALKLKRERTTKPKDTESESSFAKAGNSESNEEFSTFITKQMRKTTKHKHHKTFVTLYPEIISYMTKSDRKNKRTTDYIRKKFSKLSQERKDDTLKAKKEVRKKKRTTQDLKTIITTNRDIGSHESIKPKVTNAQNLHNKRFRIKSNPSKIKHKENKIPRSANATSKFESTNEDMSRKEFKTDKVDHFGSLYKLQNQQTPEMVYRGFRKSNDLKIEDTNVNTTLTTTLTTKRVENISTKRTRDTETERDKLINLTTTRKTIRHTANDNITNTAFKSKSTGKNGYDNDIKSTQSIRLQNNTEYPSEPILETTLNPNIIKHVDLRRFLNNSLMNEFENDIDEDPKKKKMNERFQEDLKKIFLVSPPQLSTLNDSNKDPIDEIEEAFNL